MSEKEIRKFDKSNQLFERALKVIPGGVSPSQSPYLLVFGSCPCFITRAEGARFWDVDGNEYIDYMCSYGPMVLGYRHPKVEKAVRAQAEIVDICNLPTELSIELAERLTGLISIADWATFAKNGSDVTTYACRVARFHTGRSKIIMVEGAYHGIGAWCILIPAGVTPKERADTLTFSYNDTEGFLKLVEENKNDIAGVVISPFRHEATHDSEMPAPGFLETIRKTCDDIGALLILDDIRAGFRMHIGGSLECFGIKPDLACYSKAMANGYPISACVGKESLKAAASNVYLGGTFFSSAIPFAAALATLDEMEAIGAIELMDHLGEMLKDGMLDQADLYGQHVSYSGPNSLPYMTFPSNDGYERGQVFHRECYQRGVFLHPNHNWFLSAAHTEDDIGMTLDATDAAFKRVKSEMG